MSERNQNKIGKSFWVGILLLIGGGALLLQRLDVFLFPPWLFSWKTFLIALGLIIGVKRSFNGVGWLIMILVGTFFLLDDIPWVPWDFHNYGLPVGVIIIGLFILVRSVFGSSPRDAGHRRWNRDEGFTMSEDGDDYFDIVAIFGGSNRKVFSKKFKGGEATCIFGGAEIDLTQADIEGPVVIDVVQIFGGMKLIIPANWQLKSDITTIFGGSEDKRARSPEDNTKKVHLTGFAMFGGVEIKSY